MLWVKQRCVAVYLNVPCRLLGTTNFPSAAQALRLYVRLFDRERQWGLFMLICITMAQKPDGEAGEHEFR